MAIASSTAKSLTLALCTLAGFTGMVDANAFRGSGLKAATGQMSVESLRATMLDELMAALGSGNRVTEQRLQRIEEALRPTFLAMPKNALGNLDHAAVRYALHRLFVQQHGMFVKGLEPGREMLNGSSPTGVLEDRVPAYVQSLFEDRLNGHGLGMHELAILAATLEHLIHDEALGRLKMAYQAHGLLPEDTVSQDSAEEIIDTFMVLFLSGSKSSELTSEDVMEQRAMILEAYPAWPESQKFTREVQRSVLAAEKASPAITNDKLTFNATSQIVEEIGERYGRWQNTECVDLKAALLKIEHAGTGRVLLKDFYGGALGGAWQFTESVTYLQELGALDDTDPKKRSVIIPNYVNSPSNCLASSSIYSVCCINECEALMDHLEHEIAEPTATPERVLELVAKLPSSTVEAPRTMPEMLRTLLDEVASRHHGRVPLHTRLFAQWMHHAYPRECAYPHKSGTTNPMTPDEWMQEYGVDNTAATDEEMRLHAEEALANHSIVEPMQLLEAQTDMGMNASQKPLMWTVDEELVVVTTAPSVQPMGWSQYGRAIAFLAASVCASLVLRQTMGSATFGMHGKHSKHALPFAHKEHVF